MTLPYLAEGRRLPVEVALDGGNPAEHRRLRQFGQVEVSEFGLEPLDEAEACSGLGVPLGDVPAPAVVGAEQLHPGDDGVGVVRAVIGVQGRDGVGELLRHELVPAAPAVVVLPEPAPHLMRGRGGGGVSLLVKHEFLLSLFLFDCVYVRWSQGRYPRLGAGTHHPRHRLRGGVGRGDRPCSMSR